MKRPLLVTFVALAQVVIGILPTANFLRALREGGDMVEFFYPGIFSLPSLATGTVAFCIPRLGGYGLWNRKLWGWWLALLGKLAWLGIGIVEWKVIISSIRGGANPAAMLVLAGANLVSVILLALSGVRRFYWRTQEAPVTTLEGS